MSSRLLARLLMAATGSVTACGGTTGLEERSPTWVTGEDGGGGAAGSGGSYAGTGGAGAAGGSSPIGGAAGAGGTTTANPFCKAQGCVATSWCGAYGPAMPAFCHCDANGQSVCGLPPPPLGPAFLVCYENPSGETCAPLNSTALYGKLNAVYQSQACGSAPTVGPSAAVTSAGVAACCYQETLQGCTGRPMDVDGTFRVARLARRSGWDYGA